MRSLTIGCRLPASTAPALRLFEAYIPLIYTVFILLFNLYRDRCTPSNANHLQGSLGIRGGKHAIDVTGGHRLVGIAHGRFTTEAQGRLDADVRRLRA